ncbi:MAG: GWxTD domain-containing protein [Bacteroidota bacterium]
MSNTIKALFLSFFFLLSINGAFSRNIEVAVQLCKFYNSQQGPYVESYISVDGTSLVWIKNPSGKMQSSIDISIIFAKGDSIFNFNNYTLLSPEIEETEKNKPTFFDIKRYFLPSNNYTLELTINDFNKKENVFSAKQNYSLEYNATESKFSSIEFLRSYSSSTENKITVKNGYDLIPFMGDFYGEKINELSFYGELYNTHESIGKQEKFLINYSIENYETKQRLDNFSMFKKMESNPVVPFLQVFDITNLPSGNYNLIIEAKNKSNEVFASTKLFFQRSLPLKLFSEDFSSNQSLENTFVEKYSKDTLIDLIRCLRPISDRLEVDFARNVIDSKEEDKMKLFLYQFWVKRERNNPKKPYDFYMKEVSTADQLFGTKILRGFQTDRGRVYLQYGKPDVRDQHDNDSGVYPYEIWQYYKLNNRTNRRFVFYSPELATNRWVLLHSDAIGETRDDRWQLKLEKIQKNRSDLQRNLDTERGIDYFGNRINENFNTPR